MRYLRNLAATAVAVAVATMVVGAPAAYAIPPDRQSIPAPKDIVITGQSAFPVLAHFENGEIDTTYFDKAGYPVKLMGVFPGQTMTMTNVDTGKSITLPASGLFKLQLRRNGTITVQVTGHGPFITNPITGDAGIWYLSGQLSGLFDQDGNPMSPPRVTGQLVNLCPGLA